MSIPRLTAAALPFLLLLLLLLAVFRHAGAGTLTRKVGGIFATPVILAAMLPRLSLGTAASPGDAAAYLVIVGIGLALLVLVFGRRGLE